MRHDLPPTDEDMDQQIDLAHDWARDHCPVCDAPLVDVRGRLMCFSDMCRERTVESCDGC